MLLSMDDARGGHPVGRRRTPGGRGVAIVAALAVVFAQACAPAASESPATATASPGETGAAASPTAGAPQTLVAVIPDPANLDPHFTTEGNAYTIGFAAYETLVRNKVVDGRITGEMEPHLAQSWEVSPDGTVWTFRLREGLVFSDGTPLDAEAVKFSFERLVSLNAGPAGSFFAPLASVEVIDPLTVALRLKEPYAPFLSVLATYGGSVVNPKVMDEEKGGDLAAEYLAANLAGSGPFVLEEFSRGQQLVLAANPNYWGPKPQLGRIIFRSMPEASAIRLALTRGDIDWSLTELPPDMLAELEGQSGIRVISEPIFAMNFGYMNNTRAPFDNVKVRQAVNYAIDYDTIINQLLGGHAERVRGPIPPGLLGHDDEVFQYSHDPEKARQLLAEAGLPDGFSTTLVYANIPAGDQLAQFVQANLSEVGVNVELEKVAEPARRERLANRDFDMSIGGWTANYSDPNMFMGPLFDSRNHGLPGNRSYYTNPQVDELVRKAAAAVDQDERVRRYREAQDLIIEDAPYFFLFHAAYRLAVRDNLSGVALNPSNVFNVRFDLVSKGE